MKNRFFLIILLFLLAPLSVQANDYLEKDKHYSVIATGMNKIHFKIPVWAYGFWHDYYMLDDSYISYTVIETNQTETIAYFQAEEYGENSKSSNKGTAWLMLLNGRGEIIVTSMANGVNMPILQRNKWSELTVVQREDDDCDQVTFLEFDWFPPSELNDKKININLHLHFIPCGASPSTRYNYTKDLLFTNFRGSNNTIMPKLQSPYLYQMNENGLTGYGYAAIPYTVFDEPVSYTTSMDTTTRLMTSDDRAGNLYVMTNDTVQEQFYANFKLWRNREANETMVIQSDKIDIPPYHRIHSFHATEETDSTGTFTGNNIVSWSIVNPICRDIIDGDYFVIERATDSTFSDAEQIKMVALRRDSTGIYSFTDESRNTWTGNMGSPDTINTPVSRQVTSYTLRDESGNPVYTVDLDLHSDRMVLPSQPVYYRIIRASASVWGWDNEFAQQVKMYKNNYLAPLAATQEPYTKDAQFDENHRVHFRIRLDNAEVTPVLAPEETFELSYTRRSNLKENVTLHTDFLNTYSSAHAEAAYITVINPEEEMVISRTLLSTPQDFVIPRYSRVYVEYLFCMGGLYYDEDVWRTASFEVGDDSQLHFTTKNGPWLIESVTQQPYEPASGGVADYMTEEKLTQLKDSIYQVFKQEYESTTVYGRCMWDKTAHLVLVRTVAETGQSVEIIIPQDSILRQTDGSWIATFTDVADKACTHYRYAVRIDQTNSDLRVLHPETQLLPVALNGPELYFDEGAEIKTFTATKGDASTAFKPGVMLNWRPTNQSVDEYVLQRRPQYSDVVADTIYTGVETSFFDETAVPNQVYEYTITARFNCNGKGTSSSASAEGWRSPYGEISGSVIMPDNSGMKGVQVALEQNGTVLRTMTTDATGTYRFDSLQYDINGGTDYAIVPTHAYTQFSYNNTSAQSAAIRLSADNAVARGINFANTSGARITGRILYKNSTVPVAGAMFLLNGDTIRNNGAPVKSGIDGSFEILVTQRQPNRLQVFKPGHTFEGDGILRVEDGEETFSLTKALDGIRFYDLTTVRLVGRVAGGNDQKALPEAFGLGKNNLGEDLQLVLQLEGDNTAHLVHDPNDLTRDTTMADFAHVIYHIPEFSSEPIARVVGTTHMLTEKKRIIIRPDVETGEFEVDLLPVKYKVVQATARGYATLFAAGQANEVFDLTDAPLTLITDTITHNNDLLTTNYNAVYDRIYHTPVQVELVQNLYGIERRGFGEPEMEVSTFNDTVEQKIPLYTVQEDRTAHYTLGYPVFYANRKYQFMARAYETYSYNNDPTKETDTVPQRGGNVIVRNGLHNSKSSQTFTLDHNGVNKAIWLMVDNVDVESAGTAPLRTVTVALETEGTVVQTNSFSAFVAGTVIEENTLRSTDAAIQLIDILRDPTGSGSSAYIESGTTYNFGYSTSTKTEFGVIFKPTWGSNISNDVGIVTAPAGTGSYIGGTYTTSHAFSFDIPITYPTYDEQTFKYSVTTTNRIQTSSSSGAAGVGANADIFMGATIAQLVGKAKTICIINDTIYRLRQPAIQAGTMLVLAQGTGTDGRPYYLVTGEKVMMDSYLSNTFVYTQSYILKTIIPQLALDRQNLLMNFANEDEAKAMANATGHPVYWYHGDGTYINDTLPRMTYDMILPDGDDNAWTDEVASMNLRLLQWIKVIVQNEREKVEARTQGQFLGSYSASAALSFTHSDAFNASTASSFLPSDRMARKELYETVTKVIGNFAKSWVKNNFGFASNNRQALISALNSYHSDVFGWASQATEDDWENVNTETEKRQKTPEEIATVTNASKFTLKFEPVANVVTDYRRSSDVVMSKKTGFTLVADPMGDITVSVYRAKVDTTWHSAAGGILDQVGQGDNSDLEYGSYVFYTEGGATLCPHIDAEETQFFNEGTPLGNGTEWVAKPELTADRYEIADVSPDRRATFRIQLRNLGQLDTGIAADGMGFYLYLDGASNPDGAKVYINGAPINQNLYFWIAPGSPITQTLEVERGTVDDYNLTLGLYVDGCAKTRTTMNLGVHFLPVSTEVEITMPRQNWVMNTLSPQDSAGYYLPISIEGFDIHHKNFDHIEFQYKLSTQSDEMWVNQCSFYADDSLYALATGNKAMIENGRIAPFRFYGERDPMEQQYDLRAVSFCRYGSGFVTKASPVISGTKDTRAPRVFGAAQPADAILGVGNDLKLRFNEPIAGNYLDEDNNFQIVGMTNESGILSGTSLHFSIDKTCKAQTMVERSLTNKSFTIDMMVRPANSMMPGTFFYTTMPNSDYSVQFGCGQGRLVLFLVNEENVYMFLTEPNVLPSGVFSRVIAVYDNDAKRVRFYVGTKEAPLSADGLDSLPQNFQLRGSAPLTFGAEVETDMLEARIWTKALTTEEIAATDMKYLTGYERDLMAYYRMDEGRGDELTDKANGATLYCTGTTWNHRQGISVAIEAGDRLTLDGNLLSRSAVYDASVMLWFKAASDGTVFEAGRHEATDSTAATGLRFALEDGNLVLYSGSQSYIVNRQVVNNEWHHLVLTINRTMNNAAVYVDGELKQSFSATLIGTIGGGMYLGGDGFAGNIDDLCFFEQALPKFIIEDYDNLSPSGDEMGLIAYLPFEQNIVNDNGIYELVFSPNDQRIFRDADGNVVNKVIPLLLSGNKPLAEYADKTHSAPTRNLGQLTKMNFDWSFNNDELLINLNMADREINKQTVYITVRDVEDLNGNPMASPVSWVAFVDRNSLKWSQRTLRVFNDYENQEDFDQVIDIINTSGNRHQYKIESIPDWLTVNRPYGTMNAQEELQLTLTFDANLPVGVYNHQIYLTDEDGLAEPLIIEYTVVANPPYTNVDLNKFTFNMSVCGQVMIAKKDEVVLDTDENDIIYAMYKEECVGMAHIAFDEASGKSELFLTVYGTDAMNRRPIRFQLWQASTGKIYDLTANRTILFSHGFVYGCGDGRPVILTTSGSERQTITLQPGWNWISTNMDMSATQGAVDECLTIGNTWSSGDIIKNTNSQTFCTYDNAADTFAGSLKHLHFSQMYMTYSKQGNTIWVSGNKLHADSMKVEVRGDGQWSPLPCLFKQVTPLAEALADYYDNASVGDMIKSHERFAYFSEDKKWVGDLTALRPGEGYLFRRMKALSTVIRFFNSPTLRAPLRANSQQLTADSPWSNPSASTNMTMICVINSEAINSEASNRDEVTIHAFIGDELVGVAHPLTLQGESEGAYYFLTIQSDQPGTLRFATQDGIKLTPINSEASNSEAINGEANKRDEVTINSAASNSAAPNSEAINYTPDMHIGTLRSPVILAPEGRDGEGLTYKIIENDHVIIIRNNERYDVTGKKLQ